MFSLKIISHRRGPIKYPVKTCCVSDYLSGYMLAMSWSNLVILDRVLIDNYQVLIETWHKLRYPFELVSLHFSWETHKSIHSMTEHINNTGNTVWITE